MQSIQTEKEKPMKAVCVHVHDIWTEKPRLSLQWTDLFVYFIDILSFSNKWSKTMDFVLVKL